MNSGTFDPWQDIELMDKVRNKNRRQILLRAYIAPVRYNEILSETGLKPGSIYHHLKVLEPLIMKQGQGVYIITETGRAVVEALEMVEDKKPVVVDSQKSAQVASLSSPLPQSQVDSEAYSNNDTPLSNSQLSSQVGIDSQKSVEISVTERFSELWVSRYVWIFVILTLTVSLLLAIFGISLIGSGIYRTGSLAFAIDIIAFFIACGLLYTIEDLTSQYSPKGKIFDVLLIRLSSMLPAVIVGITVYILYLGGVTLSQVGFNVLFVITVLLGWFISLSGISFLRGRSVQYGSILAFLTTISDLLIGLVMILSQ